MRIMTATEVNNKLGDQAPLKVCWFFPPRNFD